MDIPNSPGTGPVHLDNSILIPLLNLGKDPDLRTTYQGILFQDSHPDLRVSSAALGELNLKLINDYPEKDERRARRKFRNLIDRGAIELCALGTRDHWTLRTAGDLREKDTRIDQSDALIIAAAMADHEAQGLYMSDKIVTWKSLTDFLDGEGTWVEPPT